MTRLALGARDRATLAGFTALEPERIGESFNRAPILEELRAGLDEARRLLLLYELIEGGDVTIPVEDREPLLAFLWQEARDSHETANYERVKGRPVEGERWAQASEREAEVCARLIEQLGGDT